MAIQKIYFNLGLIVTFLIVFSANSVQAASLFFSPSSGSFVQGGNIVVNINVSSTDQAMNAASGTIIFPQDKLEVISLSKSGSIFNLWAQEPVFSNTYGTVNFEGIVLNPGFTGSLGRILTITFASKSSGLAVLNFTSGSVLANDGNGTNILTNSGSANLVLGKSDVVPQPIVTQPSGQTGPEISSPTHPNQSKWYSLNRAEFSWHLTADAKAVKLLYDRNATTTPTIEYIPPIASKEITDLADGIYYFHARVKNDKDYGATSHFKFQIDTTEPDYFTISEIRRQDLTNPKAKFNFSAKDSLSGIDYYGISIDNGPQQTWEDDGTHIFETDALEPGNHTLVAKVFDRAGNSLESSAVFPIAPLGKVEITDYPKHLNSKDRLVVKGAGPENVTIILFMQQGDKAVSRYETQSKMDGTFTFVVEDHLKEGVYQVWAQAIDIRSAKSYPSEKLKISVRNPIFSYIGSWAISILTLAIPILALIFLIVALVLWMHHRLSLFRKKLRREVYEVEDTMREAFSLLRDNMKRQTKLLERVKNKRSLTAEEEHILMKAKKDLDDVEKSLTKEIRDIKKEVK